MNQIEAFCNRVLKNPQSLPEDIIDAKEMRKIARRLNGYGVLEDSFFPQESSKDMKQEKKIESDTLLYLPDQSKLIFKKTYVAIQFSLIHGRLFKDLVENREQTRTKTQLIQAAWGINTRDELLEADLRVTMYAIRKKLENERGDEFIQIQTVSGIGYKLTEQQGGTLRINKQNARRNNPN